MSTLTISIEKAIKAYRNADKLGKQLLSDLFDKEIFNRKITDRVKNFLDACEITGADPYDNKYVNGDEDAIAYEKLKVIVSALNEGWKPNWNDDYQRKWYPWFYMNKPGFRFYDSTFDFTYTYVGSRLCFKSEELSTYAAKQFLDIYKDYFTISTDNNE